MASKEKKKGFSTWEGQRGGVHLPERNEEVAAAGAPDRTTIVGSRQIRPSTKPRRVNSFT